MADTVRTVMAQARLRDGAISVGALATAGMDRRTVEYRARTGWLCRMHRGVYLVGAVAGPLAREHAALLATGLHAVLSHRSAGFVWRILPRPPAVVDVTLAAGHRRRRRGIAVHQSPIGDDDVRVIGELRLTSPARTLIDLAPVLSHRELELAFNEAQVLGLVSAPELLGIVGGRPGASRLRELLTDAPLPTRSRLERRMARLLTRASLPLPRSQARVLHYTVDFLWERERVIVEVDGFAAHGTRMRFEDDRARDAALLAAGYRVLRFTWRQLETQPGIVAARLAAVLARSASA